MNIEVCPEIAEQCVIDTSGFSRQLPSLILFEKGRETRRFPPISDDGKIAQVLRFDYKTIVSYLGVAERYYKTKNVN